MKNLLIISLVIVVDAIIVLGMWFIRWLIDRKTTTYGEFIINERDPTKDVFTVKLDDIPKTSKRVILKVVRDDA